MTFVVRFFASLLILSTACFAQSIQIVSGNGQVVQEQFMAQVPFRLRVVSASGQGVAGIPVSWKVTPASAGSLLSPSTATDNQGFAMSNFFGSSNQPGTSFVNFTISASTSVGAADFAGVISLARYNGIQLPLPFVQAVKPSQGSTIEGVAGTTLPAAVQVRVVTQGGVSTGQPIPKVGLRMEVIQNEDSGGATVACNAPGGVALTDNTGLATCDLVLGSTPGLFGVRGTVGEFWPNVRFLIRITPGVSCTYAISPAATTVTGGASTGQVALTTGSSCAWTAQSNAPWLTVAQGSGTGPGNVGYSVAANTGGARSGTLTIAGQTLTVNQSAAGQGSPVSFVTNPSLPGGTVGSSYSLTFAASGGTAPYSWSAASLPPGLALAATSGVLSGSPTAAGSYPFDVTVRDAANIAAVRTFTLAISAAGGGGGNLSITNPSFPNGVVGTAYSQAITTTGACTNPFAGPPEVTLASGTLPPGLALERGTSGFSLLGNPAQSGSYSFVLQAIGCGATATRSYVLVVTGSASSNSLSVAPAAVNVSTSVGVRPPDQALTVTSSTGVTEYSAVAATTSGGNWLMVSPTVGSTGTGGTLTVSFANLESLAAGTYDGTITITPPGGGSPVVVPVRLIITQAAVSQIAVTPAALVFDQASGATQPVEQTLAVTTSSGSAQIGFSAVAATTNGGNWLTVIPSGLVTPATLRVQANSSGLAAGTYDGTVTVSGSAAGSGTQVVRVTLRVAPVAALTVNPSDLAFTYDQVTAPGAKLLTVSSSAGPLNFTAAATTQSGGNWLAVTPASAVTPTSLSISVNALSLPPGTYQGAISLQPNNAQVPLIVGVRLVVTGTLPVISAITNGASFTVGAVAPGEIVTIFGGNLGPTELTLLRLTDTGLIDTTLAGSQILFNGIPAPLLYTSAGQVTVVVPYALAGSRSTRVEAVYQNRRSTVAEVAVAESAPGLFAIGATQQGAIVNQDGTVNGAGNGAPVSSIVSLYATGEGLTTPASTEGSFSGVENLAKPLLPVSVQIGGQEAEIAYAGAAPYSPAGMIQINVRVPSNLQTSVPVPVVLRVGSNVSRSVNLVVR